MFASDDWKVEPDEGNTGVNVVCEPEIFEAVEVKMEPPEDDTVSDPQMLGMDKVKEEPPEEEDGAGCGVPPEPQDFVFVPVKVDPCNGGVKKAGLDESELQASASTADRRDNTKSGYGAAPHRKPKAVISGKARRLILSVARCCDLEKESRQLLFPLEEPLQRAAFYTGHSVASLQALRRGEPVPRGPPPAKKRKTNDVKAGESDERSVREAVEEFYTERRAPPTLGRLTLALREKTGREWGAAALRKALRAMGYVWRKVGGGEGDGPRRTFLLERFSLQRWRSRFLVKMKHMRKAGSEIFYLDESWIDTNLTFGKWREGKDASGSLPFRSAVVVRSVGSRKGFLAEARQMFRTGANWERAMTADFEKWFETDVLAHLPPESVVVMDAAPHRSRQTNPAPSAYDPKVHMLSWLRRRGVACEDATSKDVLWQLIRANGGTREHYVVDQMAAIRGHAVVRLPPNVRDLSAADLAWAKVMECVRRLTGRGTSLANLHEVVTAAFRSVTAEDWEDCCETVQRLEEDYWKRDRVMEDAVDFVMENPGSLDSSDDSEDSITEDSESESN